jgi:hypothetical protein
LHLASKGRATAVNDPATMNAQRQGMSGARPADGLSFRCPRGAANGEPGRGRRVCRSRAIERVTMPTDLKMRERPPAGRSRPVSSMLVITCASLAAAVLFAATVRFVPPTHAAWPVVMGGPPPIAPL